MDGLDAAEAVVAELGPVSGDATLAEMQGMTAELGEAIARLAEQELAAGRLDAARTLLQGLVVTNHRDADAWALLSATHRRLGQSLAARFCAEVASRLAPADPWIRLTRAESLLGMPGQRGDARRELAALTPDREVGGRARSLLQALGP